VIILQIPEIMAKEVSRISILTQIFEQNRPKKEKNRRNMQ